MFGQLSFGEENIEFLFDKSKGYSQVVTLFGTKMLDATSWALLESAELVLGLIDMPTDQMGNCGIT